MCEIKCPQSNKKLTTQYKFFLMDVDAKRPGGGGQNLVKSCGLLLWTAPTRKSDTKRLQES